MLYSLHDPGKYKLESMLQGWGLLDSWLHRNAMLSGASELNWVPRDFDKVRSAKY